jgi:DNA polymerase elongation subunit (family B)
MPAKPKVITLCGSSRFCDIMAVIAWILERDEKAITMGLHLLPDWYVNLAPDHIAEHEGVAEEMDELHLRKIDMSDEIFVINHDDYIGESTAREIAYAKKNDKPVRLFLSEPEILKKFLASIREEP